MILFIAAIHMKTSHKWENPAALSAEYVSTELKW